MERLTRLFLSLLLLQLLCCHLIPHHFVEGAKSSGSTSSISIYQSSSSLPPLAESFSEGACIIPQTARKLDPKWLVRQSTFYIPIASQFTYRLYAETFLSRAGVSDQDVKSMCLTMDFFPDGPGVNLTNTGFDLREFKQTCPVIWRGQFTCLPVGGSPGVNPARARSTDNYVVSVDNQSYMLIGRCIDGFFKDYLLLTTRPVVSPELYHTVRSTIKELGFDERKLQMLTYDSCLRTDRFVTAVNIHHHHNHHHHHQQEEDEDDQVAQRITIKTGGGGGGGGGIPGVGGGRGPLPGQLRPSFGGAIGIGGGGAGPSPGIGGGLSRRIQILQSGGVGGGGGRRIQIQGNLGGGGGGGRGNKVEELETYYAIIP